ncbi:MAG: S24/S26 family peptidase [Pseudomonadota bacterium]
MLSIAKVTGESMDPVYRHGDFVVVTSVGRPYRLGDDVLCDHPSFGLILKRVVRLARGGVGLGGLNLKSLNAADLGTVERDAIRGRVILHVPKGRLATRLKKTTSSRTNVR